MRTIILLLFTTITFAQQTAPFDPVPMPISKPTYQVFVEIRDTVQVAYKEYFGDKWVMDNDGLSREWVKDSVGLDTLRIYSFFYEDYIWTKHYIKEERFFITKPKGSYNFNMNY